VSAKDITHLSRHRSIAGKIRSEKDGVRTEAFGADGGHRGTHAEFPRLIRRCADHGAVSPPSDNDGLATQLRIVPLLDGSVECVHVDVHNFAHGYVWTILGVGRTLGETTSEQVAEAAVGKPLQCYLNLTRIEDCSCRATVIAWACDCACEANDYDFA
jgi:hypothetical protein